LEWKDEGFDGSSPSPEQTAHRRLASNDFILGVNVPGISNPNGGQAISDSNLAVGPNHIVQIVKADYAIYNKQGTQIQASRPTYTLFQSLNGAGQVCSVVGTGAVFASYDKWADRWVLIQATANQTPKWAICMAVSQTNNPTGGYYQYEFVVSVPTPSSFYKVTMGCLFI